MHVQSPGHVLALADAAYAEEQWPLARQRYLEVLQLESGNVAAMLQLSYIESWAGGYTEAARWSLCAARSFTPGNRTLAIGLMRRLRTFNALPELRRLASQVLAASNDAQALAEGARQLGGANDFALAMACAEAALALAPEDPQVCLVHAQLLAHGGDDARAVRQFDEVLARHPYLGAGWWMRSRLRRQTPESNHVAPLMDVLRSGRLDAGGAASVARALHKEFDDLGNHAAAWKALEVMCAARRDGLDYRPEAGRRLVDALIRMRADAVEPGRSTHPIPIFIVGMHRSGTTLLEQLLDASPEVRALGELNDLPCAIRYATDRYSKDAVDLEQVSRIAASPSLLEGVGRRYQEGVAWRLGHESHFTDKLPSNYLNVGFILRAMPLAKVIHLVRDPRETCFSNLRELFSDVNAFSYDQQDLAAHFIQYDRLMRHWHDAFPGAVLDVEYSKLVAEPADTMRKVAAFCGLPYVDAMASPDSSRRVVATASSVQVRAGIERRSTPKWVPYAKQLEPMISTLREAGLLARYESSVA